VRIWEIAVLSVKAERIEDVLSEMCVECPNPLFKPSCDVDKDRFLLLKKVVDRDIWTLVRLGRPCLCMFTASEATTTPRWMWITLGQNHECRHGSTDQGLEDQMKHIGVSIRHDSGMEIAWQQ
jgi:hypothetical protein